MKVSGNIVQLKVSGNMVQGGPFNWAAYWTAYWAGQNLNLWVKKDSRSGLTLTDSINPANNPTILPSYFNANGVCANISDNGALDIGANNFTICGWIKSESVSKAASRGLFGKIVNGNKIGRYGFYAEITSGNLIFLAQSTGGLAYIISTTDFTSGDDIFVLADINQSTNKIRFFINNVQYGGDLAYTGTFTAPGNEFEFMLGAGNNSTGSTYDIIGNCSLSDCYVFNKLLTPTEQTSIYNRNHITGFKAYWPCISSKKYIYDVSGVYHLTINAPKDNGSESFGILGSRYGLDYGFSLYKTGMGDEYIPFKNNGDAIASISSDGVLLSTHAGNSLNHNLCNSNILFTGNEWDRSSATYFEDLARRTEFGYLAASPNEWHISLINNLLFQCWGKNNHKAHNFTKITDYSYKSRSILKDLITSADNIVSDYSKIITGYCKESVFVDTYENDYIYWKESTDSIIAVNGAKQVKYEPSTDIIYLSLDNGLTWAYNIAVPGANTYLQMGYIFDNGNILIGTSTKLYLSTDNLSTINEVVPKDITGGDFSPTVDSFLMSFVAQGVVGTKTVISWINYSINAATEYININVWYTTDNGVTVKSAYLANTTITPTVPIPARHGHGVHFNVNDNTFWVTTGDGTDECNIIQGAYNDGADTWVWTKLYGDNDGGSTSDTNNTYYKIAGIDFIGSDIYWSSDSSATLRRGVYKCTYAGFNDTANYSKVIGTIHQCVSSKYINNRFYGAEAYNLRLITSNDLISFIKTRLYNIEGYSGGSMWVPFGEDENGWLIIPIVQTLEFPSLLFNGNVLKVKLK